MAVPAADVKKKILSHSLAVAAILATVCTSSCSLDYAQGVNSESSVPEFVFSNATFNRYENSKLTMSLKALQLEQYKSDGATYGQNVTFSTWNDKNELETEGSCGLLSANTKDKIYMMFNDILLKSNTQNIEIRADNLRWDGQNEQLTTGADDKVSITRNDIEIEGRGFSASGVSRSFAFAQPVSGTIETSSTKNMSPSSDTTPTSLDTTAPSNDSTVSTQTRGAQ